jgi:hypothetical protein
LNAGTVDDINLLTHIAADSASLCGADEKLSAFVISFLAS